jgi:hypothetical protein
LGRLGAVVRQLPQAPQLGRLRAVVRQALQPLQRIHGLLQILPGFPAPGPRLALAAVVHRDEEFGRAIRRLHHLYGRACRGEPQSIDCPECGEPLGIAGGALPDRSQRTITVRMSKDLHEALKNAAHQRRVSLNMLCVLAIATDVCAELPNAGVIDREFPSL